MGIRNLVARAYGKAGDKVAKLAALSPEQLKDMQQRRAAYLAEIPDPNDSAAEEMTARLLAASGVEIYNAYLPQLDDLYVPIRRNLEYEGKEFHISHNIRYFRITKWVTDKKENSLANQSCSYYNKLYNRLFTFSVFFMRMVLIRREIWPH